MAQTKTNQRWAEIDSVIKEHKADGLDEQYGLTCAEHKEPSMFFDWRPGPGEDAPLWASIWDE